MGFQLFRERVETVFKITNHVAIDTRLTTSWCTSGADALGMLSDLRCPLARMDMYAESLLRGNTNFHMEIT